MRRSSALMRGSVLTDADVTRALGSPASRAGLLDVAGRSDPLLGDALRTVVQRGDVIPALPGSPGEIPPGSEAASIETDAAIVTGLTGRSRTAIATLTRRTRPTHSRSLSPATSPRKWGWRCLTSRT